MPEEKNYDDELVRLLARGELSDRQIAERLGLSPSQVGRIARGEERPDLQPRILAAMRETLKQAWKNGGRLDNETDSPTEQKQRTPQPGAAALQEEDVASRSRSPSGSGPSAEQKQRTPQPTATAKAAFDRHLAVELIAAGHLTLSQIAERLGIHKTTAWRIMTGRSHPELQPLIAEAQQHYRDRARRLGVKWAAQIVTKQIKVGLKDNGWVGLRARQDLLDRFLAPEPAAAPQPQPAYAQRPFASDLKKLPEPLQTEVIRALGGPVDEDEEWGGNGDRHPLGTCGLQACGPAEPVAISADEQPDDTS